MRKATPALYARALIETADGKTEAQLAHTIANFLAVVRRNGDVRKIPKIIEKCQEILRKKEGRQHLLIESARELSKESVKPLESPYDDGKTDFEIKVNPDLVAGVRLTMDESKQLDGSLSHLLNKMFEN